MGTLRKGSTGDGSAGVLQHALNARPYLHLTEDGVFGTKTENAVREFQRRVRLTDDGVYGPQTHALLWARVVQADGLHVVPLGSPSNSAAAARPPFAPLGAQNNGAKLPARPGQAPLSRLVQVSCSRSAWVRKSPSPLLVARPNLLAGNAPPEPFSGLVA